MSQVPLLLLIQALQTMISFSCVPQSVLPNIVCDTKACQAQHNDLCSQIDRVADGVTRCIPNQVCPAVQVSSVARIGCFQG